MEGQQLSKFVIGKRVADKARAPLLNPARKALKSGARKLRKQCGADVDIHQITPERPHGGRFTALDALMSGHTVTLQAWRCVRAGVDMFDAGEHEMIGELTVKL